MANRKVYPVTTPKSEVQLLTAKLQGAAAAALVNTESANMGGGEVATITRTGTGAHSLTLRKKYPELKAMPQPMVIGTTDNMICKVLTWDVVAQTATIQLEVGGVATDAAATDFIHLVWYVRNSGFNR